MPPACRPTLVSFRNIDFDDTTNSLSPAESPVPSPALLHSVARAGILHPPILREQGGARLQIVTGRRRLLAAKETRKDISSACLMLPDEATAEDALAISLEDTVLRGNVSVAEQAIFFHKILNHVDEEKAARRFLPILGQQPRPGTVRALLELLGLEEHLLLALHENRLHPEVGRALLGLSFTDRLSLFEAMETAALNPPDQQRFFQGCRELAARQGGSIMAVLADSAVRRILGQQQEQPSAKAARLMLWLQEKGVAAPGVGAVPSGA